MDEAEVRMWAFQQAVMMAGGSLSADEIERVALRAASFALHGVFEGPPKFLPEQAQTNQQRMNMSNPGWLR